jgi:hypothetical protein
MNDQENPYEPPQSKSPHSDKLSRHGRSRRVFTVVTLGLVFMASMVIAMFVVCLVSL